MAYTAQYIVEVDPTMHTGVQNTSHFAPLHGTVPIGVLVLVFKSPEFELAFLHCTTRHYLDLGTTVVAMQYYVPVLFATVLCTAN